MEKEILNASYCIDVIEADCDRVMNVSCDGQVIADWMQNDGLDHVSASAYFNSETDAREFLSMLPAKTSWIGDRTRSRGTVRVIGYTLWKVICDEDGEADFLEPLAHKFSPFVGKYKSEREFWDDGNK